MAKTSEKHPFFGFRGGWLTFWITVSQITIFNVVVTQNFLRLHNLVGPAKTNLLATVTAIYDIGYFFGAVIAFTIGERLGRKNAILQMIVGRIVLGIGNGINTATAPIWQTETAQAKWRGKLVILEMAMNMLVSASSIESTMVFHLSKDLSRGGSLLHFSSSLSLSFLLLFPDFQSPRWLIAHGCTEEATKILACIEDKPTTSPIVTSQLHEIQYSVDYERSHTIKWKDKYHELLHAHPYN
ncbi:hypothetical protein FSHL1_001168 [Fusarium sambucinum]